MRASVLLSLILAGTVLTFPTKARDLDDSAYFQNLTTKDGLSQMSVTAIRQDHLGYLWFGTRSGIDRFDGRSFRNFRHDLSDETSLDGDMVRCIFEDGRNNLWVGTSRALNLLDRTDESFRRFYFDSGVSDSGQVNDIQAICSDDNGTVYIGGNAGLGQLDFETESIIPLSTSLGEVHSLAITGRTLYAGSDKGILTLNLETSEEVFASPFDGFGTGSSKAVNVLYLDRSGKLWAGSTKKGILLLDTPGLNVIKHFDLSGGVNSANTEVTAITEDEDGNIIVGTTSGLMVINSSSLTIKRIQKKALNYSVRALATDSVGSIWVGTYTGGVFHSNEFGIPFQVLDFGTRHESMGSLGMMTACEGNLWIGTGGNGLVCFNPKTGASTLYPCVRESNSPYRNNNVKSILREGNSILVGSYTGILYNFDIRTRTFTKKVRIPEPAAIFSIVKDGEKHLLGTYSGNSLKEVGEDWKASDISLPGIPPESVNNVSAMIKLNQTLLIGTKYDGLYVSDGKSVRHITESGPDRLVGNTITSIYPDSKGNILLNTAGNGLNVFGPDFAHIRNVGTKDGLADGSVMSAVEDPFGQLWVVTKSGISQLGTDYSVLRTYRRYIDFDIDEFTENSILSAPDGYIYVGANSKLLYFKPVPLFRNDNRPPVVISELQVNDGRRNIDFGNAPSVTLKHGQNNLKISFSALNYIYPRENRYKCILEGHENEWNDLDHENEVTYVGLSPGKYRFTVIGSNNDGVWNEEGASLDIRISKPLYNSIAAYICYILLFFTLVYISSHIQKSRQKDRQKIALKEQETKLYRDKIDLFTNFSHELRTPLTLIKGPIDEVVLSNDTSKMDINGFRQVYNNLDMILTLVDQIMTFQKSESGTLHIHVSEGDFIGFTREMRLSFSQYAIHHDIDLTMEEGTVPSSIWYDRRLFERVYMNLLSNAFKHTGEGGHVKISLGRVLHSNLPKVAQGPSSALYSDADEYLRISVENSGSHINPDDLVKIFDPFYQSSRTTGGTGIGLAVVNSIVNLHHGAVWAENVGENNVRFTVLIPEGRKHFNDSEIICDYHSSEMISRYYDIANAEKPADKPNIKPRKDCSILVVEDNKDLLDYINRNLSPYFKVIKAMNGREGLAATISCMPSLIISDIMMPVMDGLQMCGEIKGNPKTAHIPIILLSARSLVFQMKEGLELGADDYITKPFNMDALLLKVSNMLNSKENLKSLYAKSLTLENMGIEVNSSDEKFLQSLNETIAEEISNPDLTPDEFCEKMGMSRTTLYRKIESSTGLAPAKYLLRVRLHLASKLLKETDKTILEIVDAVGLTNPAHFSTVFKKQYGVSPSAYRRKSSQSS